MRRRSAKKGFTLTEIILVTLLIGVGAALFNTVFFNNWFAYEDRIKRANLWSEANQCFEQLSIDGRNSKRIDVSSDQKSATLTNSMNNTIVIVYTINNDGTLKRTKGSEVKIFSTNVVFNDSNFSQNGSNDYLLVNLKLKETVFMRDITTTASTEVSGR